MNGVEFWLIGFWRWLMGLFPHQHKFRTIRTIWPYTEGTAQYCDACRMAINFVPDIPPVKKEPNMEVPELKELVEKAAVYPVPKLNPTTAALTVTPRVIVIRSASARCSGPPRPTDSPGLGQVIRSASAK